MGMAGEPAQLSRLHSDTGLFRVGSFAVHPSDPRFAGAGQMQRHEFVFPRTSVWIHRPGKPAFVADPSVVTYYNRGEPYSRSKASEEGDRCDWFAADSSMLLDVVRAYEPAVVERPERPFRFTHGPSDATSYRWQRLAVAHASGRANGDALVVDELMLHVLDRLLRLAYDRNMVAAAAEAARDHRGRELAQRVQLALADRYAEPLRLATIGREVGCSPFHLCRTFRGATGSTLARYRHELRLRRALERVAEPRADLTEVALDCGFSSHSHFTAAFRAAFGETPSSFRRAANGGRLAAARNRLPARAI
jgi:AraC-like DNA-binding protein